MTTDHPAPSTGIDDALIAADRGEDLFVTGRAGTGKSTLLQRIVTRLSQPALIVAPTALAAMNAGGTTIHRAFGFAPRRELSDVLTGSYDPAERTWEALNRAGVLVVDEVSMVRVDLFDAMDRALRLLRDRPRTPFGGMQVLLFGDLRQLPPVAGPADLRVLTDAGYSSEYFISSLVMAQWSPRIISLTTAFRQHDPDYLAVLGAVRSDTLDESGLALLNRVCDDDGWDPQSRAVYLTPYRAAVEHMNARGLATVEGAPVEFPASATGEVRPTDWAALEERLVVKQGARVVATINDPAGRWVNGSTGVVTLAEDGADVIRVQFDGRRSSTDVERMTLTLQRPGVADADFIMEDVGSLTQFPLRLGWAMTIHKAQGLTLDRVYLDLARGAFAPGQTYVALSRVRSHDDLRLARPVRTADVRPYPPAVLDYLADIDG